MMSSNLLLRRRKVKVELNKEILARDEANKKQQQQEENEQLARLVPSAVTSTIDGEDAAPRLLYSDTASIDSNASLDGSTPPSPWSKPYVPPPILNQSTILGAGVLIFVLAMIWPPLILLFFYLMSKLIPYTCRINDDASKRRRLFADFRKDEELPERFRNIPDNMDLQESYWVNERGMVLCTAIMKPRDQPIKAVICYCHGYTDCSSFMMRIQNQRLVEQGIAVASIEYEGHGRSDGPLGLISNWNKLIDDVSTFFSQVAKQFPGKPVFLMGESMGGAVAYCTYNRRPDIFRGVVFVCPMCKISDDMLPPQPVIDVLSWLIGPTGTTSLLGYLPIAPARQNVSNVSYKLSHKLDLASRVPTNYDRNPRLATARELIHATQSISNSLRDFEAPFLVLHGKEDRVTDPRLSRLLYEESPSKDKSIELYDGMWHCMLKGEPDENIDRVYGDIITWVTKRANDYSNSKPQK